MEKTNEMYGQTHRQTHGEKQRWRQMQMQRGVSILEYD